MCPYGQVKHADDSFLTLTTDGINFILSDQEICDVINKCADPTEAADVITQQVRKALVKVRKSKCLDTLTCCSLFRICDVCAHVYRLCSMAPRTTPPSLLSHLEPGENTRRLLPFIVWVGTSCQVADGHRPAALHQSVNIDSLHLHWIYFQTLQKEYADWSQVYIKCKWV